MKNSLLVAIGGFFVGVAGIGLFYLIISALTYFICLGFGLEWSWLLSLGVTSLIVLLVLVSKLIKGDTKKKDEE